MLPRPHSGRLQTREAPRRVRGFTIIELMAVLAIAAVLAAAALPNLTQFLRDQRVKTASFDVFSTLVTARSEALLRNASVTVTPTSGTNWASGWQVTAGAVVLRKQDVVPGITIKQGDRMLIRRLKNSLPRGSRGVTMMEVLVTLLIVTLGLLGAAGMQSRMQVAQVESYQRAQAIVLLQDMTNRIAANGKNAASYATTGLSPTYVGNSATTGTEVTFSWNCASSPPTITQAQKDLCNWSDALFGASETSGGSNIGAMIGARGCVALTTATMPREVLVSVVWQGFTPTQAPGTTLTCGSGLYGANEATRRIMVATVKVGCLQNDPSTGNCVTP